MKEQVVRFGENGSLVGVITFPPGDPVQPADEAVLFLNAGLTHRVGPNRLYVGMARGVAEDGRLALRFDFSGIGDSVSQAVYLTPEQTVLLETSQAIDYLCRKHGIERFVLVGICSGAAIGFLAARKESRVSGVVLINAQAHLHGTDPDDAVYFRHKTLMRHSWRMAFSSSFAGKNWKKFLRGKLNIMSWFKPLITPLLRGEHSPATRNSSMSEQALNSLWELERRGVRLIHIYAEADEGLDYIHVILGRKLRPLLARDPAAVKIIRGSNHLFTLRWSQDALLQAVRSWIQTQGRTATTSPRAAVAS